MNLPTFTPASRARLLLSMNQALGVSDQDNTSQEAAFVSAVTHSESPGLTLLLAECLEDEIDRQTAHMGVQHVIVDPSELRGLYDQHTVDTALKLAGCYESARQGGGVVWSTCKNPKITLPRVVVDANILNDWTKIE